MNWEKRAVAEELRLELLELHDKIVEMYMLDDLDRETYVRDVTQLELQITQLDIELEQ